MQIIFVVGASGESLTQSVSTIPAFRSRRLDRLPADADESFELTVA